MHMFRIKCCYNETALNTFHVIKLKWSTVLRVMTAHQGYTVFVLAAKVTVNGGLIRHTVRHTRLKKEHWMGSSCHCAYLLIQDVLKEQKPTQCAYIILTLCFFFLCCSNHKVEEYTSSKNNKACDCLSLWTPCIYRNVLWRSRILQISWHDEDIRLTYHVQSEFWNT